MFRLRNGRAGEGGRGGSGGRGGRRVGEMGVEDVRERRINLNKCLNSSCDIAPFTTSHRKCCITT